MEYVQGRLNSRGMVEGKHGDWVFVDWPPRKMSKDGELAFEQLVYLRSLQTMQQCAELVENTGDAARYERQAKQLSKLIIPTFWNAEKGAMMHHTKGGQLQDEVTRYANMFAVLYDILDESQRQSVLKNVLQNDSVMKITTPYMRFYELEALCALGQQKQVMDDMRSYWGGMLAQGATTFWENYEPSWSENSIRIDELPNDSKKDFHGDYGMLCYKGYRMSLCHGWSSGIIKLIYDMEI